MDALIASLATTGNLTAAVLLAVLAAVFWLWREDRKVERDLRRELFQAHVASLDKNTTALDLLKQMLNDLRVADAARVAAHATTSDRR